jgi:hypothetical protein
MLGLPMTLYTDMGIKDRDASWLSQPDWDLVRRDADMLAAMNMALLWYEDESYPWLLAETAYPPVALYVRGRDWLICLPRRWFLRGFVLPVDLPRVLMLLHTRGRCAEKG